MRYPKSRWFTFDYYSNIPLILAIVLIGVSKYWLQSDKNASADYATYGYYLLVIGTVWKFVQYIKERRKDLKS